MVADKLRVQQMKQPLLTVALAHSQSSSNLERQASEVVPPFVLNRARAFLFETRSGSFLLYSMLGGGGRGAMCEAHVRARRARRCLLA